MILAERLAGWLEGHPAAAAALMAALALATSTADSWFR